MSVDTQVANHDATPQHQHGLSVFFYVWAALLVFTGAEVYLAYQNMEPVKMLMILMALSLLKAALIILFFMHMKYESARMRRVLMPVLVICLCLMSMFFADAVRILHLGVR